MGKLAVTEFGSVVGEVSKLKKKTDGVVLVAGSGTLVGTLLAAGLVDELRLMVFPTILGRGRRLFPDGIDRLKLTLAESRAVGPDGVQIQIYRRSERRPRAPARPAAPPPGPPRTPAGPPPHAPGRGAG